MLHKIPAHVIEIYRKFTLAGYEIYLVGGCVRDLLANRQVKDWDFTTSALPEEILKLFPDAFYDNAFGTVGVPVKNLPEIEHAGVLEITTYRTETGYDDHRHPREVKWGTTIEEDLSRRDFTINAMALNLSTENSSLLKEKSTYHPLLKENNQPPPLLKGGEGGFLHNNEFQIIDPYNGQQDIKNKIIRSVGDPNQRFKEDALRLMRAIRFAAQLAFSIDPDTLSAITSDAPLLAQISKERARDELIKILSSDYPYEGIMLLKNTCLLQYILPELLDGIGVSQERPGRHHKSDVFTHNVLSLKFCPSTDPVVRFAALIHDIGKPRVQGKDEQGFVIFYNHEVAGARIAREIADRLRFSKKDKEKISDLIRWHMFSVNEHITDAAIRRFIRRIGVDNVKDMIDLRIGDRLGGGTQTAESWRLKLFKDRVSQQLAPAPFSINDLAIDGHDIMKELNLKPGKKIGELLQKLFEEVDEDLSKNTKDYLLQRLKALT